MKEGRYYKADDVQTKSEEIEISSQEADALIQSVFPNESIQSIIGRVEFSENVHFSGKIRIIPNAAIRFDGFLLDDDNPSYVFDISLSSANSQLFGARLEKLPESKSMGWGRPIFNKLRTLSEELGLNKFIVHPGLADGGWYWARLGAVPIDTLECQSLCDDYLIPRINNYKEHISTETYEHAVQLIQNLREEPSLVGQIAALKQRVTTDEGTQTLGRSLLRDSKWMAIIPSSLDTAEQQPIIQPSQQSSLTTPEENHAENMFPTFTYLWNAIQNISR